jgi:hypothetical protein
MSSSSGGHDKIPNTGQFVKGRSGNPNGRPKGAKNFRTLVKEELRAPIHIQENGKKKKVPRSAALVKRWVNDALQGNDRARDKLLQWVTTLETEESLCAANEFSAEDQMVLDHYFEKRLAAQREQDDDD